VLGNGGFGKVFLGKMEGKCHGEPKMYAIKQMAKAKIHQKNLVDNILLEKKIMKELKCNFIARSHYSFRDNNFYYIAMEWAQGGDVFSFIRPSSPRREKFLEAGEDAIRFILGCVILGL
jgi:serine/threonine protein kinase